LNTVDLPPPDGPTRAVSLPGSATNDMPRNTAWSPRYAKCTSLNSSLGEATVISGKPVSDGSLGGESITSNRMRTPTSPLLSSIFKRASRLAGS
jgi:hypothetical protein